MDAPTNAPARLHQLLGLEFDPAAFALTVAQLAAWKPLIENAALAQSIDAEALAYLVVDVARAHGDAAGECLALAYWISGNALYLLDLPKAAVAQYAAAEALYRHRNEPLQLARMGVGKVGALGQLGQYSQALAVGNEIGAVLQASPLEEDQARWVGLRDNMGWCYDSQGRYLDALACYQQRLDWWLQKQGTEAAIEQARARINLAVAKACLGMYDEARYELHAARRLLNQDMTDTARARDALVRLDGNMLWLETRAGSPESVILNLLDEIQQRASNDTNQQLLLQLSELDWRLQRGLWRASELAQAQELQAAFERNGLAHEALQTQLLIGGWLLSIGDLASAIQHFDRAKADAENKGDALTLYQATVAGAKAQRRQGNPDAAHALFIEAIAQIESGRRLVNVTDYRAGFLDTRLDAFQNLAALQIETTDDVGALHTVERAKAATLADMLGALFEEAGAESVAHETTPPIAQVLEPIRQPILPTGHLAGIDQSVIEQEALHLARITERKTMRPSQIFEPQLPADDLLIKLSAQLPAATVAVQYAVLEGHVWAFLIAQAGLLGKPIALGPVPDLQRLQADLARVIHIGKLPLNIAARFAAQQTQAARVPLATWHSAYVAPLQAHLAKFTHLLIIPDGLLHHIPFACLFDAATQRYLCEDFVIETAPSLTTWLHLAQRQRQRQAQDIAKPETLSNTNIVVGYSAQGRLAHAVDEARRVAQHMPASTMLLETNATRQNLIECASSANAQVIYLATHGLFRADAPAFSFIELADGKLFVLDILHSRLRAKLVVLSACETGVGKLTGNESMGLVRAFLIAGAQSVVATHWPVADHATTALMSAVLGHVATGKSAAQALQQAQCAFLASTADGVQPQYTHPYYWGSVFLNGYSSSVL